MSQAGRAGPPRSERRPAARAVGLTEVDVDREHLEERLGLFVIIVLGESVAALVLTAAQTALDPRLHRDLVAGFLLLVLLWLLTFSYGFASAPGVRPGSMPPRFGLPLHLASTLGILLIGVGLGAAVADAGAARGLMLWVIVGGVALHSAASLVGRPARPRPGVLDLGLRGAGRRVPAPGRGGRVAVDDRSPSPDPGVASDPSRALAVPLRPADRRPADPPEQDGRGPVT